MSPALPRGYKQAEETLKLFATRGLANFQWLTLNALDKDFGQRGNLDGHLEEEAEKLTERGEAHHINPLNKLLATIGADVDTPPPPELTRAMVYEPDPNAEWATKQVKFTIKQ